MIKQGSRENLREYIAWFNNEAKSYVELITRAQKYMNAEELLRSKGRIDEPWRRSPQAHWERPTEAQHEMKRQRVEELDLQRYNSVSRFEKYTPIVLPVEQILMEIKHINLLREPEQMKTRPHVEINNVIVSFIEIMVIWPKIVDNWRMK